MNLLQKLKSYFTDDVIRTPEDLRRALDEANLPDVRIFEVPHEPELRIYDPENDLKPKQRRDYEK